MAEYVTRKRLGMGYSQDSTSTPYVTPQTGDAWAADAATRGTVGTQRLLSVGTEVPTSDVQRALELSPDDMVVVRRRLILADDTPVELADSYYPAIIAAGTPLAESKKIKGGAVRILDDLGHGVGWANETITARLASTEEAELLAISIQDPLLILARTSRSKGGRPVEFTLNRMVPSTSLPLAYRVQVDGS